MGSATASPVARRRPDLADFGNQGIDPNLQSPDIYQYNLTLERELPGQIGLRVSYIGSTMRKLLVDRDYNTLQASTVPFDPEDPADYARLPFPLYGYYMDIVSNAGSGQFHARPARAAPPLAERAGLQRRLHARALGQQRAGYRQQHHRAGPVRSVRHRKGSRSRSERGEAPHRRERDRGTFRWVTAGRTARTWRNGRTALFGGWTVSTIFQARSGQNLTPFFSGFYTTSPWNTGKPLDGLGNVSANARGGPDQIGDPNSGGSRDAFFNQAAYAIPAPGKLGNAKKGSLKGPGTWVVNFAIYKDVVQQGHFRLQFSALLDNAFNHPQFFPSYGSGFVDLTSFLIDGDPNNGHYRCAGCRHHSQRGRLLAWTGHTFGHQSNVLMPSIQSEGLCPSAEG